MFLPSLAIERRRRQAAWLPAAVLILAPALLLGGCATTGRIHGRIAAAPSALRETVVLAWPAGADSARTADDHAVVEQRSGRMEPRVLAVARGATVTFRNQDRVFHKPFSVSPVHPFRLDPIGARGEASVRFEKSGVVQVFCELHPDEDAYIVVAPGRWHARPAADGTFALDRLPPGSWNVRVWHPQLGDRTRSVELAGSRTTTIDFRY